MTIKKVGMIGCGSMGQGICQIAAQAGYQVITITRHKSSLDSGIAAIASQLRRKVDKGEAKQCDMDDVMCRIKGTLDPHDFADCDIVVESIIELLDEKREIFAEYDKIVKPDAIFTSNTSTLSIMDMAAATKRSRRFIGSHLFWPVPRMKLVEVIPCMETTDETVKETRAFWESCGKDVIIAKDTPAFVVDRLFVPFVLEAMRMLQEGVASKEDIDKAVELGLNHPMGPLRLMDLTGCDIPYYAALSVYEETKDTKWIPPLILKKMIAAGHLGRKTGKGFYDYPEVKKPPKPDRGLI
jgi:3-hydroxybutyryl-CoA dehydrogenase